MGSEKKEPANYEMYTQNVEKLIHSTTKRITCFVVQPPSFTTGAQMKTHIETFDSSKNPLVWHLWVLYSDYNMSGFTSAASTTDIYAPLEPMDMSIFCLSEWKPEEEELRSTILRFKNAQTPDWPQ